MMLRKNYKICLLCFFLVLGLSACGLTPIHKTPSTTNSVSLEDSLNSISITMIKDKIGVDLRNSLIDRMHTKAIPRDAYTLDIIVRETENTSLALASDGSATRAQLKVTYAVILKDTEGKTLLNRDIITSSNYNILGSQYSTLVAEEEAQNRALNKVSDDIIFTLRDYFIKQRQEG